MGLDVHAPSACLAPEAGSGGDALRRRGLRWSNAFFTGTEEASILPVPEASLNYKSWWIGPDPENLGAGRSISNSFNRRVKRARKEYAATINQVLSSQPHNESLYLVVSYPVMGSAAKFEEAMSLLESTILLMKTPSRIVFGGLSAHWTDASNSNVLPFSPLTHRRVPLATWGSDLTPSSDHETGKHVLVSVESVIRTEIAAGASTKWSRPGFESDNVIAAGTPVLALSPNALVLAQAPSQMRPRYPSVLGLRCELTESQDEVVGIFVYAWQYPEAAIRTEFGVPFNAENAQSRATLKETWLNAFFNRTVSINPTIEDLCLRQVSKLMVSSSSSGSGRTLSPTSRPSLSSGSSSMLRGREEEGAAEEQDGDTLSGFGAFVLFLFGCFILYLVNLLRPKPTETTTSANPVSSRWAWLTRLRLPSWSGSGFTRVAPADPPVSTAPAQTVRSQPIASASPSVPQQQHMGIQMTSPPRAPSVAASPPPPLASVMAVVSAGFAPNSLVSAEEFENAWKATPSPFEVWGTTVSVAPLGEKFATQARGLNLHLIATGLVGQVEKMFWHAQHVQSATNEPVMAMLEQSLDVATKRLSVVFKTTSAANNSSLRARDEALFAAFKRLVTEEFS